MLEEKDLQTIGSLLDQKLKENNKILKDEIVDEVVSEVTGVVNLAFSEFEGKINKRVDGLEDKVTKVDKKITELDNKVSEVDKKIELRPTKNEIFSWGDKQIVELQLRTDKLDYLHLDELDKLPPPAEISRALVERGYKVKADVKS